MDTSLWPHEGIGDQVMQPAEDHSGPISTSGTEKKPIRPRKEQALKCPRCCSKNTKFCYYNNYSLTQPRYFCKNCRRYWTHGGSLRNVPVGGGSRRNRTSSISSHQYHHSSKKGVLTEFVKPSFSPQLFKNIQYDPSHFDGVSDFASFPFGNDSKLNLGISENSNDPMGSLSSCMMPMPVSDSNCNSVNYGLSGGFSAHGFKPCSSSTSDYDSGIHKSAFGIDMQRIFQDQYTDSSRIIFPFQEYLKPVSRNDQSEQERGESGESNGYWNLMLQSTG